MLTGFEGPDFNKPDNQIQRRPSIGSAVAKLRGANVAGMPAYAAAPHLRGGTDNLFHYATYEVGAAPQLRFRDPRPSPAPAHFRSLEKCDARSKNATRFDPGHQCRPS